MRGKKGLTGGKGVEREVEKTYHSCERASSGRPSVRRTRRRRRSCCCRDGRLRTGSSWSASRDRRKSLEYNKPHCNQLITPDSNLVP